MLIASQFSLQLSSRYNKDYLHSSVMKEDWNTGNYRYLLKKGIVAINRLTFYFCRVCTAYTQACRQLTIFLVITLVCVGLNQYTFLPGADFHNRYGFAHCGVSNCTLKMRGISGDF